MSTAERWRFHPTVLYLTSPISLTHSCLVPKSSCFFFSSPAIPSLQTQRKCRQKPYVVGLPKIAIEAARNHRLPIHRIWALFSPIYRVTAAEIPTPACTVTRHGPAGCGIAPSLQIPAPLQPAPDSSQELKPFPHVPIPWNTSLVRSSHDQSQEPNSSEALLLPASFKVTLIVWALSFPLPKICCAQTA